jgi:DNA repair exonuclease SbcCD ATPase subunit
MRFVKVIVKNFQAIESAEVEFGRGLNIMFGPNDLGKSTLACAIRAALLVPPSSSETQRYLPWTVDAVPEVTLTFTDDDNRFWKVRKCFGAASSQRTADLHHSKDGVTFANDCRGREVEDQLRKLLGWGIPSPGGRGAPRGLPTSFLAHVLLSEQADVEAILEQSTEEDGAPSGRERLRKALAGLAEDPWFKKVLTETQRRVDALFTPTGQRKRGRDSPFAAAAEDVKRRAERVGALKKGVEESRAIEDRVCRLREQWDVARDTCEESATALATLRQQHARTLARVRAEEKLGEAMSARDSLDRQATELDTCGRVVGELEAAVALRETHVAEARATVESAEAALRGAEAALRAATSEDGAHQREVARAKLGEERAELEARAGRAEKRREAVEAAQKAVAAAAAATKTKAEAERESERARAAYETAKCELSEAEKALELARGILAYGHWQAAEAATKLALAAQDKAEAARAEAERKERAAQDSEAMAAEIEADAKARGERLPDAALVKRLEALHQQIVVAEAALGGGFSLALCGTGKVPVHVAVDGTEAVTGTSVDGRLVLEADRAAVLRVGDLIQVEIVAGAAEKRHALEALRERWTSEAQPVLERAGLNSAAEIREQLAATSGLEAKAAGLRSDAKHLRTEAENARHADSMNGQRAEELLSQGREAGALEPKLGALDPQMLASSFSKLGPAWKVQAEQFVAGKEAALTLAREKCERATRACDLANYKSTEAVSLAAATEADAARVYALVGLADGYESGAPAEVIDRELAKSWDDVASLASQRVALEEELRALEQEGSNAVGSAKAAVEEAKSKRNQAIERQQEAAKALEDARSEFHRARGELEAMRKALESADRAGFETRLAAAHADFQQYASDAPVSPEQLAEAERRESEASARLDQIRAEILQSEGALTKVGGVGVREELAREEEACTLAAERQRELEVDADAWKLLRETLDVVEKEGSSHLGRSLAAPVSARLVELTQGRYGGLRLDQHLKAETVEVPSVTTDASVLDALSVGTRDQIATLLRLTVAEQLKSAIVLDDHLVHTDPDRLKWFRDLLRKTALSTQVVVLTCRPHDYLAPNECPDVGPTRDLAGGMVRTIDVGQVVRRFGGVRAQS